MATKLTLSIDSSVIASAKRYAKRKGISISKIVEEHLAELTRSKKKSGKENPLDALAKLKGIAGPISSKLDYSDMITGAILEKHMKPR